MRRLGHEHSALSSTYPMIEPKPRSRFPETETVVVACWDTLVYGTFEWIPDSGLLIGEVSI